MADNDRKTKKQTEGKETQKKTKNSCDCGCIPPPVKKQRVPTIDNPNGAVGAGLVPALLLVL